MSLKARIEAVIYAAEEPVTLAQLASLFRDEALASRAARSAAAVDPEAPAETDLPAAADLIPADEDSSPAAVASEPAAQNSSDAEAATADFAGEPQSAPEPPGPAADQAPEEAPAADAAAAETISVEAAAEAEKKAARQRDREVRDELRRLIDELIADYSAQDSGLEIREVAGGFRFGTRPEYHDAVRAFIKTLKPPFKLSLQALETLAVIAYKQPITAPEIGEIRGVDSGGVLGSLVARKLITTAGRKQVLGRPILYKTTKEFLVRFGLKEVSELPSLEEFEKMASELAETEAEGPIAPEEKELPFAQNEIAEIEESSAGEELQETPGSSRLEENEIAAVEEYAFPKSEDDAVSAEEGDPEPAEKAQS
ncbi:MAG: SMC-Scp complex subunit ScpB [Acidobacteriota bacterium]